MKDKGKDFGYRVKDIKSPAKDIGFKKCVKDSKLMTMAKSGDRIAIAVQIDDIYGICGSDSSSTWLYKELSRRLKAPLKNLGELEHGLGIDF